MKLQCGVLFFFLTSLASGALLTGAGSVELKGVMRLVHQQLPEVNMPDVEDMVPDIQGEPVNHTHPDANPETPMVKIPKLKIPFVWEAESELDVTVEAFLAIAYVSLIASVPLVLAWMEPSRTKIQMIQAASLFIWLGGGLWLFTRRLKFSSGHFETDRSLTMAETIYLLSQIITTVGYGDIVPAFPRGQVFIGLYVLAALLMLADMITEFTNIIIVRAQALAKNLALKTVSRVHLVATPRGQDTVEVSDDDGAALLVTNHPESPPLMQLLGQFALFFFFVAMGTMFYHTYEGKAFLECVYMAIVTLSTVGFGAVTADTEIGKVFGAFWMLFGVVALTGVVGTFAQYLVARKQCESYCRATDETNFKEVCTTLGIHTDEKATMDMEQYLQLAIVHTKIADVELVQSIQRTFKKLNPDGDGTVAFAQVENLWSGDPK